MVELVPAPSTGAAEHGAAATVGMRPADRFDRLIELSQRRWRRPPASPLALPGQNPQNRHGSPPPLEGRRAIVLNEIPIIYQQAFRLFPSDHFHPGFLPTSAPRRPVQGGADYSFEAIARAYGMGTYGRCQRAGDLEAQSGFRGRPETTLKNGRTTLDISTI
jgi:hypothetical protein